MDIQNSTPFDENKSFSQVQFEKYLAANGTEKAQGYLEALQDLTLQIGELLHRSDSSAPDTPRRVSTKIRQFHAEKVKLLKSLNADNQTQASKLINE